MGKGTDTQRGIKKNASAQKLIQKIFLEIAEVQYVGKSSAGAQTIKRSFYRYVSNEWKYKEDRRLLLNGAGKLEITQKRGTQCCFHLSL